MKYHSVHIDGNGWILCPHCGCKTRSKVKPDTVLINYPLYCPKCKKETIIQLNLDEQLEPGAKTQSR